MAQITAKDVAALRAKTGLGMMDCKKALVEADGDIDAAIKILREKGTMNGMITTNKDFNLPEVLEQLKEYKVTGVVNKVTDIDSLHHGILA